MAQMILHNTTKIIKMKKLNGMKGGFSSTENKKLQRKDLKSILGGDGYKYVETDCGSTCYDKETWKDGVHISTLKIDTSLN
jgi:putative peptide modification target (TIGR04139 family)